MGRFVQRPRAAAPLPSSLPGSRRRRVSPLLPASPRLSPAPGLISVRLLPSCSFDVRSGGSGSRS
ncbi:hypothetical protein ACLOJK_018620, partial [Asimina triloba]